MKKLEYKAFAKVFLTAGTGANKVSIGSGVIQLLRGVSEFGSLNKAAKNMGMAYSKAWTLLRDVETKLDTVLIERDGARGSSLSEDGKALISLYDVMNTEMNEKVAKAVARKQFDMNRDHSRAAETD